MAYTDIDNPELHFQNKLYTGTGSSQSITLDGDEDMQPDWVWCKTRSDTQDHQINDSVRGTTKLLATNNNAQEFTDSNNLTSYNTDGFTVGSSGGINGSSDTLASWNWKAGGSASSNSDGDITSSISANTTAGFSIVSYTGSGTIGNTVGHGLGAIPAWIITKNRDATSQWITWHQGGTSTKNMDLATSDAEYDSSVTGWQQGINNVPTSSVLRFTAGSHGNNNVMDSSEKYISYVFVEKQGYSSFGSYTGNGNADGPFVYTGFKPAWVIIKRTDSTADWHIQDNKRNTFNPVDTSLFANTTDTDTTSSTYDTDFLSNGFKLRGTTTARNGSGNTYIYVAFAEAPFTNSSGVPCNAR